MGLDQDPVSWKKRYEVIEMKFVANKGERSWYVLVDNAEAGKRLREDNSGYELKKLARQWNREEERWLRSA